MSLCIKLSKTQRLTGTAALAISLFGCTQAATHQQELSNQLDSADAGFVVGKEVVEKHGAPVDILWVIDNSDSMASSQKKLRQGLSSFAKQYLLKDGTDIHMGVTTTDAFAANEAWEKWRATLPKTIKSRDGSFPVTISADSAKLKTVFSTKGADKSLINRFESAVSVGIHGVYEEHGFDSVTELLADNEKAGSPSSLFRKGSQRIIVFLSDEDDQSLDAASDKLLYTGSYYTGRDDAMAKKILPSHFTNHCPATNLDGVALAPMTICTRPELLLPVATFKSDLDAFFRKLDGAPNGNPNYMVVAIVAKDLSTIQALRASSTEKSPEGTIVITHEQGRRYLDLVSQVPGSFAMDIGAEDYSPVLKKIGLEIVNRSVQQEYTPQTRFKVPYAIDRKMAITVTLDRKGSEAVTLAPSQYSITRNVVEITDKKLISTLKPGDRIRVHYRPASQLPVLN